MIENLKKRMVKENKHPEIWAETDENSHPKSELGYFRCDCERRTSASHGAWWNTVWLIHKELYTKELGDEMDEVYNSFKKTFGNLQDMSYWCEENAGRTSDNTEYNAFLDMLHGYYWLRIITRPGDYNLYLHCYSKNYQTGRKEAS